jgi:hypothetical protein
MITLLVKYPTIADRTAFLAENKEVLSSFQIITTRSDDYSGISVEVIST